MTDSDRRDFDLSLDTLANVLRLTKLDSDAKFGYFKALRSHSIEAVVEGINKIVATYRPKRKDDFPVPSVISEAVTGIVNRHQPEYQSRTYEQIKESYRKRGILIGEEARERLEAEIDQRRQESEL